MRRKGLHPLSKIPHMDLLDVGEDTDTDLVTLTATSPAAPPASAVSRVEVRCCLDGMKYTRSRRYRVWRSGGPRIERGIGEHERMKIALRLYGTCFCLDDSISSHHTAVLHSVLTSIRCTGYSSGIYCEWCERHTESDCRQQLSQRWW